MTTPELIEKIEKHLSDDRPMYSEDFQLLKQAAERLRELEKKSADSCEVTGIEIRYVDPRKHVAKE